MTKYNLLNIPNKFARDDRVEKVTKLKTSPRYDNIILGSSRVYATNPLVVTKYLGGITYNAGVGTARVEDHLGFILLLKRLDKLPKNIIIGLDFYSFNTEVETNKYFLKNRDLNFINNGGSQQNYISNFLSIDALRASFKTIKNHLSSKKSKPRFDVNGAANNASAIFSYPPEIQKQNTPFSEAKIIEGIGVVKTVEYKNISKKRIIYLQEIANICKENNISLYVFTTPLFGQLLSRVNNDSNLNNQLLLFKKMIQNITSFYDFLEHNKITDNSTNFLDLTHANTVTGNLIYARIFKDKNITVARDFGRFVK